MGLNLPSGLIEFLGMLGYDYPQSDEAHLMNFGNSWMDFSGDLSGVGTAAATASAQAWTDQAGEDIEAFKTWWEGEDSPRKVIENGAVGAMVAGVGLIICSIIVLCLKIMVIVQLVILAVQIAMAIAQAAVTFGASLVQIPIFQQLARTVVGNLLQEAAFKLVA
ncbi:WXG100-like domain-containing protein [Glycomyces dulcitolivorans]|uniref:WXG100-like domain-containing protein n=1 Tax=Glycomyces dulcitolivorans TaxID=2200759 RepID=UPI000DD360F4|nr:hypothetical protein [Glycomyces dulcitolivorans]